MKKNTIKNIIIFIILLFSSALVFTINWLYKTFGNLKLEEIVFQLKVPMQGTNTDFYVDYALHVLPYLLLVTIALYVVISLIFRHKKFKKGKARRMKEPSTELVLYKKFKIDKKYLSKLVVSLVILAMSVTYTSNKVDLVEYLKHQMSKSNLIEEEYVDPETAKIEFPETKRNLIYIYLESMEATFYSKENGGAFDQSLIPELEQLATENIAFSNSDSLKGSYSLIGTTWTTGAMVAQQTGLPLKLAINANSYGDYDSFLPGAYGLGEILESQGYNQMLMVGSDVSFGGRKNFYEQHGNYGIFDLNTAIQEGRMTEEDKVWWGFNDRDLFKYAKEKILELSEQSQPFNFTMLTADTHHPNGCLCDNCPNIFEERYFNVLSCSSRQVADFVSWIQEQDFYENTTVVICGDHLSMQADLFDQIAQEGYERTTLNIIINSPTTAENTKNRGNSTMDMLPTTLASLGVTIEGNKLGLGTNLFSNEETLVEKYGLYKVEEELSKNSKFYNDKFLYDNE